VLKKHPKIAMEIAGHTDSTGPRDHNLDLSRRRARSVKKYLVDHGIDDKRLTTRGYGPDEPIASNDTPDGRAENRRIEFRIKK
jgi:OOP family OmpA-OmpF porin